MSSIIIDNVFTVLGQGECLVEALGNGERPDISPGIGKHASFALFEAYFEPKCGFCGFG